MFEEETLSPSHLSLRGRKYFSIKYLKSLQDDGCGIHNKGRMPGFSRL